MSNPNDLYFILSPETGRIKIGRGNTGQRLKDFLTGSPDPNLLCVMCLPGRGSDERTVHQAFSDERSHGEWFYPSERLVDWITRGGNIESLPVFDCALLHDIPPSVPRTHVQALLTQIEDSI